MAYKELIFISHYAELSLVYRELLTDFRNMVKYKVQCLRNGFITYYIFLIAFSYVWEIVQ